ncbi:MAG: hypothetical protein K6F50_00075 [Kiritimatiellae bacterium]|nr:hypothetical protein [Kiritimatiellia bacterium]
MNAQFDMNEFMKKDETVSSEKETASDTAEERTEVEEAPELDVQKAVVESLAADKAVLDSKIEDLKKRLAEKDSEIGILRGSLKAMEANISALNAKLGEKEKEISRLGEKIVELQEKEFEKMERNPNALALLDRDVELPDRFTGETRDHVIEVIREARDAAEKDGRLRRAQILESVLVSNEPDGTLAGKRAEMEKLFSENGNIVNGPVIERLRKEGISHKNGEEYLLPSEIIKRNY